jgi:hypothetical protein
LMDGSHMVKMVSAAGVTVIAHWWYARTSDASVLVEAITTTAAEWYSCDDKLSSAL